MKKKVVVLGSTGSIGINTLKFFKKYKQNFKIEFLSTNRNTKLVLRQSKQFNVKNIIITDKTEYLKTKKKYKKFNINFYNSFDILNIKLKKKEIFYTMISIIGIDGLKPTLNLIKLSKNIAIVNKEALICGWSLIKKKLLYYKTNFIPIDSEHFSLNILLKDKIYKNIKNIYITASGGPFLNNKKFYKKNISVKDAINHPNWKMGKKISIDSSTMMNKVFEVIEAKNIFNLPYNKIKIIIHPKSYIHAIVEYNNGIINFLAHTPDMKIPIFNSIVNNNFIFRSNNLNFKILNNLNFQNIDKKQFPLIRILDNMPKFNSLFETSLVIINDFFVNLFLEKKITYQNMIKHIEKFIFSRDISKNKRIYVKNINQIISFHKYLSLKLNKYVYKS